MVIAEESPRHPDVLSFIEEHLADMRSASPPESVHALGVEELEHPSVTLFVARSSHGGELLGVGALKLHDDGTGEVKSMRTTASARGRGVGSAIVDHLIEVGRARGLSSLKLETGVEDCFASARRLYESRGFKTCGPFAQYWEDPNSVYYGLVLERPAESA